MFSTAQFLRQKNERNKEHVRKKENGHVTESTDWNRNVFVY